MLRVYLLPVVTIDGTETVAGIEIIHDAELLATASPIIRKLIMDTTEDEHSALWAVALELPEITPEDIEAWEAREIEPPPSADYLRACELLSSSPPVITIPEMWELMRIYARRLGYHF